MGDPIGFRLLAVLTSLLEILGNLFETKSQGLLVSGLTTPDLFEALRETNDEDLFPVFYDQLFIIINSYYILRWLLSREQVCARACGIAVLKRSPYSSVGVGVRHGMP